MRASDQVGSPVVAVFPPSSASSGNPYISRLHGALGGRGVRVLDGQQLSSRWVESARGDVDIVHLHWLEYIVRAYGGRLQRARRTHLQAARYVAALRALRAAGIRLVWTVHNRRPHESPYPWLDEPIVRATAAYADALIFHSSSAAQQMANDLGRHLRVWIAPHPHYRGVYPPDGRSRVDQRASYGLDPSSFVYLMFGQVRSYKRIPETVRAFRALPDPDVRLIVAGQPIDHRLAARVRRSADGDARIVNLLRFVADEEVAALFELSDALVLNYREVFTSGALLLALSYGLPVVAPIEGSAREVARAPAVETFAPGGLPDALRAVRTGDHSERRAAAVAAVEPFTYDAMAAHVLDAYMDRGGTLVAPAGRRRRRRAR